MEKDPLVVARLARQRDDENWRFRAFLKMSARLDQTKVNALAERLGRDAEAAMDCLTCGACCRDNCITVNDEEISRLCEHLAMSEAAFRDAYVTADDDGEPAIDATPCPFLDDRRCTVYDARPDACRGYPYVGGEILPRMIGIIERAGACPIVFEMLEQLKARLGFDRYR